MRLLLFYIILFVNCGLLAQDTLTLQMCLDFSEMNKLQIATQQKDLYLSELNLKFNKWSLLPNLSAFTGFNASFGRRIDPFTNTFATNNVNSQSMGLSTSVPVFNGLNNFYTSKILKVDKKKSQLKVEEQQNLNNIRTIELFVELCKLQYQKELSEIKLENLKSIQLIQKALLKEGKISSVDTIRSYNTILNERNATLELNNRFKLKTIELNFQIGLPLSSNHFFSIESIGKIASKIKLNEEFLLNELDLEINSLKDQFGVVRSSVLPSLSLSGSLGSGFSTNNKDFTLPGNPMKPYSDQINQNLYEGIGVNLSIPIFGKGTYFKEQKKLEITKDELNSRVELLESEKEKRVTQNEQQLLFLKSEIKLLEELIENNKIIFERTLLMYKEGKITYREVEIAFIELQTSATNKRIKELDLLLIQITKS